MRNYRMDNMRYLLIVLVILGHLLEAVSGTGAYRLYKAIYVFHVPAFIFCSGCFSKFSVKRLIRYVTIFFLAQAAFTLLNNLLLPGSRIPFSLKRPYWLLWYIYVLPFYMCLTPLLLRAKRAWLRCLVLLLSVAAAVGIGFVDEAEYDYARSRFVVFLPFFVAGYFWGHPIEGQRRPSPKLIAAVCVPAALLFTLWTAFRDTVPATALYGAVGYSVVGTPQFRLGQIAAAMAWIGALTALIPDKRLPYVSEAGADTLAAYLGHGALVLLVKSQSGIAGDELWSVLTCLLFAAAFPIALSQRRRTRP